MDIASFHIPPNADWLRELKGTSWSSPVAYLGVIAAAYLLILRPAYNVFLHPLRKYPGPKLWAASSLPWGFTFMNGQWHDKIRALHAEYGHVVRIAPDELSYDVPEAWEDIYGKPKRQKENGKPTWYLNHTSNEMVSAKEKEHGRMRRLLSPGFTSAAMMEQEPFIKVHVDLLLQRLQEQCDKGARIDMFEWLSFCTFDIVGDLSFGEPFGCLRDAKLNPWLATVYANVKLAHTVTLGCRIPLFLFFLPVQKVWKLYQASRTFAREVKTMIDSQLAHDHPRPDFLRLMTTKRTSTYMTREELYSNAAFLTLAGSETTSTTTTVALYYMGMHPEVKTQVVREVLSAFRSEDEINMRSANTLPYLMGVIEESMRYHPPGPNALWRITPPEGNRILGEWVPGNTVLGIPHRTVYRSAHNFTRPDEFLPERWLKQNHGKGNEFANDRRDGFHPFSYGPRACLAMNLAYAEMRFILARMIWNFDFEIAPESRDFPNGLRSWLVWDKRPMYVELRRRDHGLEA